MFRRIREKAFFAETQKFFPATAIYNAFHAQLLFHHNFATVLLFQLFFCYGDSFLKEKK